jgi:hypothetical protein
MIGPDELKIPRAAVRPVADEIVAITDVVAWQPSTRRAPASLGAR